jgi:hypothetical protein
VVSEVNAMKKFKMQNAKCKEATRVVLGVFFAVGLAVGDAYAQAGPPAPPAGRGAGPAGQAAPGGGRGRGRGAPPAPGPLTRTADGKPDLSGFYEGVGRGANYGLEEHPGATMLPGGQGIVVDPPDGRLPMQDWARAELKSRQTPARGYDDPTAHCIMAAGVPRGFYVPSPFFIMQTPTHVVVLFERMAWRQIPIDANRKHLPDTVRLWQGDSIGHWEGDTLVVDTTNFNGKSWLNEAGEITSHALHVVERFTPVNANTIMYRATLTDPIVYTRPFTVEVQLNRDASGELLEVACHEDNQDLAHMRDVKEAGTGLEKK